jgi:hypothetical protein
MLQGNCNYSPYRNFLSQEMKKTLLLDCPTYTKNISLRSSAFWLQREGERGFEYR